MNILSEIKNAATGMRPVTIMEVCGGHTRVIMDAGIRNALPENINLVSGPGCPVCVTSARDIDCMIALASEGVPVSTYGDMLRVPGSCGSLEDAKRDGAKVKIVTSVGDALGLKDHVFFGVGFETTAPMTAYLLEKGGVAYSAHKTMPPPLGILAKEGRIDGLIDPGHVSAIIGSDAYAVIPAAQVISGFTPEKILHAIHLLLIQIKNGEKKVVNDYPEAVRPEGNIQAKKIMSEQFVLADAGWRGLGNIKNSGLEVKNDKQNAKIIYEDILKKIQEPKKTACKCADILLGKLEPSQCPLYGKTCVPQNPSGACMVSAEGTCRIHFEGSV